MIPEQNGSVSPLSKMRFLRSWTDILMPNSPSTLGGSPPNFGSLKSASLTDETLLELPKGGYIVKTATLGNIQFGLPPETIKDTLKSGLEVPTIFIVPSVRFDRKSGLNVAEFEFPAYFNFFIRKKPVTLICTQEAEKALRTVFQETLLGPKTYEVVLSHVKMSSFVRVWKRISRMTLIMGQSPISRRKEATFHITR
jgi:hypothetical protein